jgi:hypothetical protein
MKTILLLAPLVSASMLISTDALSWTIRAMDHGSKNIRTFQPDGRTFKIPKPFLPRHTSCSLVPQYEVGPMIRRDFVCSESSGHVQFSTAVGCPTISATSMTLYDGTTKTYFSYEIYCE